MTFSTMFGYLIYTFWHTPAVIMGLWTAAGGNQLGPLIDLLLIAITVCAPPMIPAIMWGVYLAPQLIAAPAIATLIGFFVYIAGIIIGIAVTRDKVVPYIEHKFGLQIKAKVDKYFFIMLLLLAAGAVVSHTKD